MKFSAYTKCEERLNISFINFFLLNFLQRVLPPLQKSIIFLLSIFHLFLITLKWSIGCEQILYGMGNSGLA